MKTLATMGIEVWRVRDHSATDPKVDELIHFIEKALNIDQAKIVAALVHADFCLSDVLVDTRLKPKLLELLI